MDNETNVRFIHSKSKGVGGHDDGHVIQLELPLRPGPLLSSHTCVIPDSLNTRCAKRIHRILDHLSSSDIHDTRLAFPSIDVLEKPIPPSSRACYVEDRELQVGPIN
jgi:hypothetical protein